MIPRRRRRPTRIGLLVAVAAALAAGACTLPEDKLPAAPKAAPGLHRGGTLTVGITAPAGVDPLSFYEPNAMLIASVLCEPLVTLDPVTGEVKPGIIKKWSFTDDGARIILQMRKGVHFHDGREVRSADISDALHRLASPDKLSYAADLMAGVAGYAQYRQAVEDGAAFPRIKGVRLIEPFSFELFLNGKNPDFLRALAHPAFSPVSKAPYDADPHTAPSKPECAGPYQLAAPYQRGASEIVLRRFARYDGGNTTFTALGRGWADEIRFRVYPDAEAAYQAQARGEVDIASVPPARRAEAVARPGARVEVAAAPQEEFIGLPQGEVSLLPFANRDLRVALSQALDRNRIVREVYGGTRVPATGFVPPALRTALRVRGAGQKNAKKAVEFGCGASAPAAGDPAAAKRAFDRAQSGAGPGASASAAAKALQRSPSSMPGQLPAGLAPGSLKLYFNDEFAHRKLAESVAAQWKEVLGLDVELVPSNWDQYLQKATVGSGFDGPFRLSYSPPYSSTQAFLGPLFHSSAAGDTNLERYSSGAFDEGLARDTYPVIDPAERLLRYRDLENQLCKDMPLIPIAFGQSAIAVSPRVVPALASGRLLTMDGVPLLREMALAP